MFGTKWKLSERKYNVIVERDVSIPMSDGVVIDSDLFRPDTKEKVPVVLGVHGYAKGNYPYSVGHESGIPHLFCRRGYAHIVINVRGSGKSTGEYTNYGPREVKDTYDVIQWIADQPWCDGNVVMWGVSYFAVAQLQIAALNPPHLKAIVPISSYTDFYRMKFYPGGIYWHAFTKTWGGNIFWDSKNGKFANWSREKMGEAKYEEAVAQALQDRDICAVPYLVDALKNPDHAENTLLVDTILNPFDTEYYQERNPALEKIKVPALLVARWSEYAMHLPGTLQAWEKIQGPKKMIIGPPIHLAGPPVYQLQYEAIRWYDYHIKGIDNGIMDEPPIRLFVPGTNRWKTANDWPLPETIWTPFYLHPKGLLSEMEPWTEGGSSMFEDSIINPGGNLKFYSPPLVEDTEIIGPSVLNLYASTNSDEALWFIGLLDVDPEDKERLLTEGWLRGSQRELDPTRSKPWAPFHPHSKREPLLPNEIYEFNVGIASQANMFRAGHRIGLRIGCEEPEAGTTEPHTLQVARPQSDGLSSKPRTSLESISLGHFWSTRLWNQTPKVVTVYHNAEEASHILLPITRGNLMGTYVNYSLHLRA